MSHPPANAPHAAVCGMQWGDEGKGKIVDVLTEQYDLIIRYNGGANAGHTVVVGDQKYALHLLPSGIIRPDKLSVIANGVVVDPQTLIGEINGMRDRGITIDGNLKISTRAHLVLPYHKQQDALMEAAVSTARGDERKIGTTGRGIGPCYADKMTRSTALRAGDLLDESSLAEKLKYIIAVKNAVLGALAEMSDTPFEPIDPDETMDRCLEYARDLAPFITDTTSLLHRAIADGRKLLFEGANGCMLDVDHGTYPYVTSSNTGAVGIYAGAAVPGHTVDRIVGIMKAYTTRVGGGPFPTELHNETGRLIRDRGNEYGTTTGRPRRCGWLDLAVVRYAAAINGATELAVMLLDVLAGFETLHVCTAYKLDGKVIDHYPATRSELERAEPVYRQAPGFTEEITGCRAFEELPAAAQQYVELIESEVGVPVRLISVGPERSQTLTRDA